jgi:hypothetical protein
VKWLKKANDMKQQEAVEKCIMTFTTYDTDELGMWGAQPWRRIHTHFSQKTIKERSGYVGEWA